MKNVSIKLSVAAAALTLSVTAAADHNSKWGEGWANMPNDVHNTRVETRGDNTAFRDFVRQGSGADSVNRFVTDDKRGRASVMSRRTGDTRRSTGMRAGRGGGRR